MAAQEINNDTPNMLNLLLIILLKGYVTGTSIVIVYVLSKTRTLVVWIKYSIFINSQGSERYGTTIDLLITSDLYMFTQKPKFQK